MGKNQDGVMIYGRVDDDDLIRVTCLESDSGYQNWLNPQQANSGSSVPNDPTSNL